MKFWHNWTSINSNVKKLINWKTPLTKKNPKKGQRGYFCDTDQNCISQSSYTQRGNCFFIKREQQMFCGVEKSILRVEGGFQCTAWDWWASINFTVFNKIIEFYQWDINDQKYRPIGLESAVSDTKLQGWPRLTWNQNDNKKKIGRLLRESLNGETKQH